MKRNSNFDIRRRSSMKKMRVVMLLSLLCTPGMAQAPNSVALDQMKKLSFLVGQWKGEGWVEYGPGQCITVTSTESVQWRLGGEVLLIEGVGRNKMDASKAELTGHDAIALMFFDVKT